MTYILPNWIMYFIEGAILGIGLLAVIYILSLIAYIFVNYTYKKMQVSGEFMNFIKHRKKFKEWMKDPNTDKSSPSRSIVIKPVLYDEMLKEIENNEDSFDFRLHYSNRENPKTSEVYVKEILANGDIVVSGRLRIQKKDEHYYE